MNPVAPPGGIPGHDLGPMTPEAALDAPVRMYRAQDLSVVVPGGETRSARKRVSSSFARAKQVMIDDWR